MAPPLILSPTAPTFPPTECRQIIRPQHQTIRNAVRQSDGEPFKTRGWCLSPFWAGNDSRDRQRKCLAVVGHWSGLPIPSVPYTLISFDDTDLFSSLICKPVWTCKEFHEPRVSNFISNDDNGGKAKVVPRQLYLPICRQLVLPIDLLLLAALLGRAGAVAGDVKLQDDGVMDHPVNRRGGGHGVGEDALPLREDQV